MSLSQTNEQAFVYLIEKAIIDGGKKNSDNNSKRTYINDIE